LRVLGCNGASQWMRTLNASLYAAAWNSNLRWLRAPLSNVSQITGTTPPPQQPDSWRAALKRQIGHLIAPLDHLIENQCHPHPPALATTSHFVNVLQKVGRIFVDPTGAARAPALPGHSRQMPISRARARRAASISQTLSPTTDEVSISTAKRSAAVRKRSGSGFPCVTWSHVTTGTRSKSIPSNSSAGPGRLQPAAGCGRPRDPSVGQIGQEFAGGSGRISAE
jgi:hypothetical protein